MTELTTELRERLATIADLEGACALLGWDQHTYMPRGSLETRIRQISTLEHLSHEMLSAERTGELLERLEDALPGLDHDSDDARLIRVTRRDYDEAVKLPPELVKEKAMVSGRAMDSWMENKPKGDFEAFRPHLEAVCKVCRREAEALGYPEQPYDALLHRFEPGLLTSRLKSIFDELKRDLVPFCRELFERRDRVDDSILFRDFDDKGQWKLGLMILGDMGYDFYHGRQDCSPHPFTTGFGIQDIRVTTRIHEDDFKAGLFSTIHEGGHALYEQNVDLSLDRTPLGTGCSLGIHESQSRLWENLVGRSKPFWRHYFEPVREIFPENLGQVDFMDFYRAINCVKPSLIRIEADEVTYSLHIFLRFELELLLLSGELELTDLPEAWDAKMQEYLGIRPPSPTEGCMQDMHWADASIGYFPTYALGNLYGVQIYNLAREELGDLDDQLAAGRLQPLKEWLSEKVYRYGRKYDPGELIERITGKPLSPAPFMEYIRRKYSEIYGL